MQNIINITFGTLMTTMDDEVVRAVQKVGIDVNKEELLKALELYHNLVHCRECKKAHLTADGTCKYCEEWKDDDGNYIEVYHDGDHFCSYGERQD